MCIYTHNTLTQAHKTMANPKRMNDKTDDVFKNINDILIENDMPEFGTKEFNDLCRKLFGGVD